MLVLHDLDYYIIIGVDALQDMNLQLNLNGRSIFRTLERRDFEADRERCFLEDLIAESQGGSSRYQQSICRDSDLE
jgi:hypothetical protein